MDRHYLQGEEMILSRSDIDVVLPALENSTKKKFNSSFTAEQRRYENLEKQIQREEHDVNQRLTLEKKDFVRSNLILKERREHSSRRSARKTDKELVEKPAEEPSSPSETDEKHSMVVFEDMTQLERSPYYFPPLYKNVEKGLKEIQTTQVQMDLAKTKEPVDTGTIRNCRYLRLSSAQESEIKTKKSARESEFKQNSPVDSFYDTEAC